ncbi:MAG: IPT/TIG domain-containing protein [Terriglobales bacterium]
MAKMFHFHERRQGRVAEITVPVARTTRSQPRPRSEWRIAIYVAAVALIILIALVEFARAGGPQYVAGIGYFNAGLAGQPVTWSGGEIRYYTDQGDLSPILAGPGADAFVADALSRWTTISTAAVSATRAGQLAEDVSGANVILNSDRTITMPVDIQPTATTKPVGLVYDADGRVTDALIGTGASGDCFTNGAFGGVDAFTTDGHFAHALVVLNGKCAQSSNSLPDLKYRLVRVWGQILGLGWSQLNLNAIAGSPPPTQDDLAGLPIMHEQDLPSCVPVSNCYPNADQPKMDDRAALSRLYPVTSDNVDEFPGKQIFAASSGRIHGSIEFTDASGNATQPMRGVNVVARWIDPGTGQPSGRYAAGSVSGFLFAGNAGNAITGYSDALGNPYNRFGSNDEALEGFFDLAGLEIPSGDSAQYQLSMEAIDGNLSQNVGPYAPWQVLPSGTAQAIVVTVSRGSDLQQDVLMDGSAVGMLENGEPESFASPRALPGTGDWMGRFSGYGDDDYFLLSGQTNRTLTVEVTALDENGRPSVQKAQPVVGMWSLAAPEGTPPPAYTFSSFNSSIFGVTQLNAQLLSSTQFRIGVADLRGDGRPDFRYHARVLYGDSVTPDRVSVRGGTPILVEGFGFKPGMTLTVGNTTAPQLAVSANQLVATVPALADGVQTLTITDPATGASSSLTNGLTFGAGPNDIIRLAQGANSATPVGGEAAYAVRVTVATPDGSTAISGATVQWNVTNRAGLSACNGASTCSVSTDESGQVETRVIISAAGTTTVTATLAPVSYTPPKSVQVSINGTSSAKDLTLSSPKVWVVQGATLDVPFTARLLANGVPQSGQTLNWRIGIGSDTMSPATVTTDGDGYGRSILHLNALAGDVQGTVCVGPGNNPCQTFYVMQVALASLKLQPVSGSLQTIQVGQSFQPIWVRVTNSAAPPNPVMGAPIAFESMVFLPDEDAPVEIGNGGDAGSSQHAVKVLLASFRNTAATDVNGLASLLPSTGGQMRPLEIEITASAGSSAKLEFELPMLPGITPSPGQSTGRARVPGRLMATVAGGGGRSNANHQSFEGASRETQLWNWAFAAEMGDHHIECSPMPPRTDASQVEPSTTQPAAKSEFRPAGLDKGCEDTPRGTAPQE